MKKNKRKNDESEIFFVMRKKIDANVIGLFFIFILLFAAGIAFGAFSQINLLLDASTLLLIATLLFMLDYLTRLIAVDDDGFAIWHVWVFCRRVLWKDVCAYREKKSEGGYDFEKSGAWYNESFTVTLYRDGKFPMRIGNDYTEYKQFKKILVQKGIARRKPKKKKR